MPPFPSRTSTHVADGLALLTGMYRREVVVNVVTDTLVLESDATNEITTEGDVPLAVE